MTVARSLIICFAFIGQLATASANVKVVKDMNYTSKVDQRRQLNVYYKSGVVQAKDVVVFIHGGSWSSGKKDIYWWLGRNLARKGVVAVTINYGLAPDNKYPQMAADCAEAIKWVTQHISTYHGNPARIFVMGHSAGGHLAELINADPRYFAAAGIKNPIKGLILDDPFGLDMHEYMSTAEKDNSYYDFLRTFSSNPKTWTDGSPLHYAANITNPHLLWYGAKTYPAIQIQTKRLYEQLHEKGVKVQLQVIPGKKHVAMITQMIFGCNKRYKELLDFLASCS